MEATFVGGVGAGVLLSAVVAAAITLLRRRRPRVRSDPDEVVPQDHPPSDDWSRFGGDEIEAALRGGAIALLDGAWVVRCAARAGGRIQRRQDLPDEAFLSLDAIKAAGIVRDALPVAVVSYPWLHPEHPDPRGDTLRLLARVLEAFITHEKEGKQQPWALFWDFASLHQHSEGGRRTHPPVLPPPPLDAEEPRRRLAEHHPRDAVADEGDRLVREEVARLAAAEAWRLARHFCAKKKGEVRSCALSRLHFTADVAIRAEV